jgi:catechol 2,3-dioxygenase-like lactoylglutathione lyase family enzyme
MLGREPNWLGGDGGARHAWFQFPNMALDVIAPHGEGAFGDQIRAHLDAKGEGIWALAFTAEDIEATHKLVTRRGMRAASPKLTRSTHDDGRKRYWLGATPHPEDTAGAQILLIAPPRDGIAWPQSEATGDGAVAALDHVVIRTPNPDRALAIYGARLGLDLRLDRSNESWGVRQLFFKAGDTVVEFGASLKIPVGDGPDSFGGLAWRVTDPHAVHARLAAAGFDVSEVRAGRKAGTHVFTVRDAPAGVPTLMLSAEPVPEPA